MKCCSGTEVRNFLAIRKCTDRQTRAHQVLETLLDFVTGFEVFQFMVSSVTFRMLHILFWLPEINVYIHAQEHHTFSQIFLGKQQQALISYSFLFAINPSQWNRLCYEEHDDNLQNRYFTKAFHLNLKKKKKLAVYIAQCPPLPTQCPQGLHSIRICLW